MRVIRSQGVMLLLVLAAGLGWAAPPELESPKGEECIRPQEEMRRNHMDILKEMRERTVREGVRVKEESFLNCQTCHPSRERFCDRCHAYVGVHPDCFECHNYPK